MDALATPNPADHAEMDVERFRTLALSIYHVTIIPKGVRS